MIGTRADRREAGRGRRARATACALLLMSLPALLAGGAAPASGAHGRRVSVPVQTFYEFTISFIGHGSYEVLESDEGGGKTTVKASFEWKSVFPDVLVPTTKSSALGANEYPAVGLGQDGSGDWTITSEGHESENCSNHGTLGLEDTGLGGGGGSVKVHRAAPGAGKGVVFNLTAVSGFKTTSGAGDGVLACEPEDFWHDWVVSFSGVGYKHSNANLPNKQPLSATVQLPPSDLKHGVTNRSVSVSASEEISDCGSGNGSSCTESFSWSGHVRFTKHKLKL